jgi:hypothetical protein
LDVTTRLGEAAKSVASAHLQLYLPGHYHGGLTAVHANRKRPSTWAPASTTYSELSIEVAARQYAAILVGDDGLVPDEFAFDIVAIHCEFGDPMTTPMVEEDLVSAHGITADELPAWLQERFEISYDCLSFSFSLSGYSRGLKAAAAKTSIWLRTSGCRSRSPSWSPCFLLSRLSYRRAASTMAGWITKQRNKIYPRCWAAFF